MKFFQKKKFLIPVLLLLILLIAGSIAGYAIGKYRTEVVMTGSVTASTRLVDSFRLSAVRKADGASSEEPEADTAYLIPGTELGFNLQIQGKSDVGAYLYVEVTGEGAELTEDWRRLDNVVGKHGGAVYAYSKLLDGSDPDLTVPLLKKGLSPASDEAVPSPLSFCGYLLQVNGEPSRGLDQMRSTFVNKFPQN